MRHLTPYSLWLGHVGDASNADALLKSEIAAVVDLAANERPMVLPRELVYCRFPLVDAAGNSTWLLASAVETVAHLLKSQVGTLVYCSGGMSRSPVITAAAMSRVLHLPLDEALLHVARLGPIDVSPGLLGDVAELLKQPSA